MLVVWNPCIRKSFGIGTVPMYDNRTYSLIIYGFGVCPITIDHTVVKVLSPVNKPWHVEVFTSSLGVWNVIPSSNLPRQSIKLNNLKTQSVIDIFIYWGACEKTFNDDGEATVNHMVVSFDLITKEFKVVKGAFCCGVWVMEHDLSFRKLFTIGAPVDRIMGFEKNDETIFKIEKEDGRFTTLNVYDPCSQQIKNL
ncbi:hypothetical protein Tco_1360201 [Tanacetum coccineum]